MSVLLMLYSIRESIKCSQTGAALEFWSNTLKKTKIRHLLRLLLLEQNQRFVMALGIQQD